MSIGKIFINFINYNDYNINNLITQSILIQKISDSGLITFNKEYYIQYNIDKDINKKIYFIETYNLITITLKTSNFLLNLPDNLYFVYGFYKNEVTKSLIIYSAFNYFPLIFMGLPNLIDPLYIQIEYEYKSILNPLITDPDFYDGSENMIITLFNNYDGNFNNLKNKIQLSGIIYEIYISDDFSITDLNSFNKYKIFKIPNQMNINQNLNIYFYNEISLFSSILYLNNYNFIESEKFNNYESIILYIEYIDILKGVFSKIDLSGNLIQTNNSDCTYDYTCDYTCDSDCTCDCNCSNLNQEPFFYKYDGGEIIPIELNINEILPKYISVLSLDLQTFNSNQIKYPDDNEFYNVLFFYNYINDNYFVKSIKMFCYDFKKYFVNYASTTNPKKSPQLNNIGSFNCDLYEIIIKNDSELHNPFILDLNYPYLFVNIDLLNLLKLIRFESVNNYFYNLVKSKKVNFNTIVDYLTCYSIKKYNIYSIDNTTSIEGYNSENFINNSERNIKINFNNGIMNCIRCKIVFLFGYMGMYFFDAKLFLDNYNIQIYHKKYKYKDNKNNLEKKKLVSMLIYLATVSVGIKIIFYNEKNSEPKASSFYNYYLNPNSNYLFNEINLSKIKKEFLIYLDIIGKKNDYQNQFLKFNLLINKNYYLLFLYVDKETFISNYNQLIFTFSQYTFKIFKISSPNANLYENKELFYITFNGLKELNIFMDYIEFGVFNVFKENPKNYFNFKKSKIFVNYYDINDYWVLCNVPSPIETLNNPNTVNKREIYFSINNLKVNQIYLYGDLTIKPHICHCENKCNCDK